MALEKKYKILIWIVAILLATNLSMGISYLFHKQQNNKLVEQVEEDAIEVPSQQRTRFFREHLTLEPQQVEIFRELNRDFNRRAWQINHRLENLRIEMVYEMGRIKPDRKKLEDISEEIGMLHTRLKNETISYYLSMKDVCTDEQKEKLNEIFISVLKQNEDIRLPQRGRRNRFN